MKRFALILFSTSCFLFSAGFVSAKTDLSITQTDVTLSKQEVVAGDTVRLYARVLNVGDMDVSGTVEFWANGKTVAAPQSVSLRPATYDDVFVDWKPATGQFSIEVRITGANPKEDDVTNNATAKKEVTVYADENHNGVADIKETAAKPEPSQIEPLPASPSASGGISEKYQVVYEQVQKAIESVANFDPVKSAVEYVNQTTGGQIQNAYKAAIAKVEEVSEHSPSLDYVKPGATFWDNVIAYKYWIGGALAVLVILFLIRKFRRRGE